MVQNFEVLPLPTLTVHRSGSSVSLSWPERDQDWTLESSVEMDGVDWHPVVTFPARGAGRWTVTIVEQSGRRFYQLTKR
jgi:hypothetical protein